MDASPSACLLADRQRSLVGSPRMPSGSQLISLRMASSTVQRQTPVIGRRGIERVYRLWFKRDAILKFGPDDYAMVTGQDKAAVLAHIREFLAETLGAKTKPSGGRARDEFVRAVVGAFRAHVTPTEYRRARRITDHDALGLFLRGGVFAGRHGREGDSRVRSTVTARITSWRRSRTKTAGRRALRASIGLRARNNPRRRWASVGLDAMNNLGAARGVV
jgi:hypothetical protein